MEGRPGDIPGSVWQAVEGQIASADVTVCCWQLWCTSLPTTRMNENSPYNGEWRKLTPHTVHHDSRPVLRKEFWYLGSGCTLFVGESLLFMG